MSQENQHIQACLENIHTLDSLNESEQEAVVGYVLDHKDWRGSFNLIHNLSEMLCQDLKNALKGYREVKHASITKTGPFTVELAVLRHYIKQHPPYEVFAALSTIKTPEVFQKEKSLSHKALFTDLFGEKESNKAFKWYPEANDIFKP